MAFSPDGLKVAVGAGDGNASLWRVTDGGLRLAGKIRHKATVRDVAFSPDGTRLTDRQPRRLGAGMGHQDGNSRSRPK